MDLSGVESSGQLDALWYKGSSDEQTHARAMLPVMHSAQGQLHCISCLVYLARVGCRVSYLEDSLRLLQDFLRAKSSRLFAFLGLFLSLQNTDGLIKHCHAVQFL